MPKRASDEVLLADILLYQFEFGVYHVGDSPRLLALPCSPSRSGSRQTPSASW